MEKLHKNMAEINAGNNCGNEAGKSKIKNSHS